MNSFHVQKRGRGHFTVCGQYGADVGHFITRAEALAFADYKNAPDRQGYTVRTRALFRHCPKINPHNLLSAIAVYLVIILLVAMALNPFKEPPTTLDLIFDPQTNTVCAEATNHKPVCADVEGLH